MKKPLILLAAGGAALAITRARRARRDVERASRPADEMVREHASITPALEAVGAALASRADPEPAVSTLTDIVCTHLDHEERAVLPLVQRHIKPRHDARNLWYSEPVYA
jgi:hypothetical protein